MSVSKSLPHITYSNRNREGGSDRPKKHVDRWPSRRVAQFRLHKATAVDVAGKVGFCPAKQSFRRNIAWSWSWIFGFSPKARCGFIHLSKSFKVFIVFHPINEALPGKRGFFSTARRVQGWLSASSCALAGSHPDLRRLGKQTPMARGLEIV